MTFSTSAASGYGVATYGPDGKPLAILPADTPNTDANEGDPKLVAQELAKWVR